MTVIWQLLAGADVRARDLPAVARVAHAAADAGRRDEPVAGDRHQHQVAPATCSPLVTVTCADPGSCPNTVAVSTYCPGSIPENRNVPDPSDAAIVL